MRRGEVARAFLQRRLRALEAPGARGKVPVSPPARRCAVPARRGLPRDPAEHLARRGEVARKRLHLPRVSSRRPVRSASVARFSTSSVVRRSSSPRTSSRSRPSTSRVVARSRERASICPRVSSRRPVRSASVVRCLHQLGGAPFQLAAASSRSRPSTSRVVARSRESASICPSASSRRRCARRAVAAPPRRAAREPARRPSRPRAARSAPPACAASNQVAVRTRTSFAAASSMRVRSTRCRASPPAPRCAPSGRGSRLQALGALEERLPHGYDSSWSAVRCRRASSSERTTVAYSVWKLLSGSTRPFPARARAGAAHWRSARCGPTPRCTRVCRRRS